MSTTVRFTSLEATVDRVVRNIRFRREVSVARLPKDIGSRFEFATAIMRAEQHAAVTINNDGTFVVQYKEFHALARAKRPVPIRAMAAAGGL